MADYVVLTLKSRRAARAPEGLSTLTARGNTAGATLRSARSRPRGGEPVRAKVEILKLDPHEAKERADDPNTMIAHRFRTKLMKPLRSGKRVARKKGGPKTAWGLEAIGATQSRMDGAGVVVAVLDTGIDASHAAFRGVTLVEQNFTGDGNGDVNGHGTHCAGTIFGRDVDGTRIGVARGVKTALIGKVLDDGGAGDSVMLTAGLEWASRQRANIISMSIGFDFPAQVQWFMDNEGLPADIAASITLDAYTANLRMFDTLLAYLRNSSAGSSLIVAATGNESRRDKNRKWSIGASIPAVAEGVISVGAASNGTRSFGIADFSNTYPRLVAPGVDILSAESGGGLVAFDGTSMACPHVAGAAALWWQKLQQRGIANPETVAGNLISQADDTSFAAKTGVDLRGAGLARCPT